MELAERTQEIAISVEDAPSKVLDVVCVGAALTDIIASTSIHPEDEQETFVDAMAFASGGSAANTAAACAMLELRAGFVGRLGIDTFGDELLSGFRAIGVDVWGVVRDPDRPSGLCYIAIDKDGRRRMYAHSGAAGALLPSDLDVDYLRSASVVHLADLYDIEPLISASEIARGHATVSLNPGGLIVSRGMEVVLPLLESVDLYISSVGEAASLTGEVENDNIISSMLSIGPQTVVLTDGEDGCIAARGEERAEVPSFPVDLVDTTGAGDAFSAGFILGVVRELGLMDCCLLGNAAAALCVQTTGARLQASLDDIKELARLDVI
jgi:sugar/nucleoside kinase (ribokinase family)